MCMNVQKFAALALFVLSHVAQPAKAVTECGESALVAIDNREGDNLPPQPGEDSRPFDLTIHLDHLWGWDADAGRFVPPAPGQGVSIDPNKPTYLLTHGWDGALDGSTCGDASAEEFTCSSLPPDIDDPDYAMSSIGAAIWDATSQGAEPAINLLAWDWKTAANPDTRCDLDELLSLPDGAELLHGVLTHIEHPVVGIIYAILEDAAEDAFDFVVDAYRSAGNVQAEGNALGTALANWIRDHAGIEHPLGTELHLIGKSHGGGVLGQAAKVLQQNGFPPDSLSTLDTPRVIPIPTWLLGQTHLIDTMRFVDPDSVQIGGRAAVFYYSDRAKFGFGAPVDGYHSALSNFALSAHQVPWYPLPYPDPAHLWISGYDDCSFDEGWYPVAVSSPMGFENTSPPVAGSALDVFDFPSGYFAERSGDGEIYSFVPMGACCHDGLLFDWCDIRTQAACEAAPSPGTYGGHQTDCCAACGVCEAQGPAQSVSALSLLRHEPFQTAGIWTSSNGVLVEGADPNDPLNRVLSLAEVDGDASLFRDIAWPSATVELSFDYMFGGVTEDETLTVYWAPPNGEAKLIYFDNALTGLALDNLKSSGPLVVAEAAGTISRLLFVYRGSGAPGGQLLIDNVRVFGPALGDIDLDGDVDLADSSLFQNCFGAGTASNGMANACWAANLVSTAPPSSDTVDLDDYAPFATAQTGALPLLRP